MAKTPNAPGEDPFDLGRIRQLVRMMRDNDLSEIDLRWDTSRICLRRGGIGGFPGPWMAGIAPPVAAAPPAVPSTPSTPTGAAAESRADASVHTITSPLVGTYYAKPSPDASAYVSIGSRVSDETTVCIIEAMKVFNEIPAGVSGVVREVLVENGAPVEFGQPLFRVDVG